MDDSPLLFVGPILAGVKLNDSPLLFVGPILVGVKLNDSPLLFVGPILAGVKVEQNADISMKTVNFYFCSFILVHSSDQMKCSHLSFTLISMQSNVSAEILPLSMGTPFYWQLI